MLVNPQCSVTNVTCVLRTENVPSFHALALICVIQEGHSQNNLQIFLGLIKFVLETLKLFYFDNMLRMCNSFS